jgi:hypothetical protein
MSVRLMLWHPARRIFSLDNTITGNGESANIAAQSTNK